MRLSKEEYKAGKARLKRKREEARQKLRAAQGGAGYAAALDRYIEAKAELEAWYRDNGAPQAPSRAQRRKAYLARRGIRPAWGS